MEYADESDSEYTSYWRDWVGQNLHLFQIPCLFGSAGDFFLLVAMSFLINITCITRPMKQILVSLLSPMQRVFSQNELVLNEQAAALVPSL